MRALLRLLQVELRASDHDGLAMVDEVAQQVVQRQDAGLVVDDGEEDDSEGGLHRRQRVELVQHKCLNIFDSKAQNFLKIVVFTSKLINGDGDFR